ncbi:MAG: alpha/beta fold hydrolase [Pleurocapsa sp. MO_226.B13]|nr:alpha/beta fold hydrolase [Pleurocapsa sp. MO_226.B13]
MKILRYCCLLGIILRGCLKSKNRLRKQTTSAIATVEKQADIEANTESKTDFARQFDLRNSGTLTWHEKTLTLFDQKRDRIIQVDFYRPQIDTFIPVVVISPGLGVDKDNFVYLGQHLASHGFAVTILNHPGSDLQQFKNFLAGTTKEAVEAKEFIDRPLDVSYLLDELQELEHTDYSQLESLNLKQVGIIGDSFGAYTALALAGVEPNTKLLQQDCQSNQNNLNWFNPSLLFQCLLFDLPLTTNYQLSDRRIAAIFAMNPIVSSIFGRQSLSQLKLPVTFVAGSEDPIAPALPEQIKPFTWLSSPNKYLLLIEKGTHIYKRSQAFNILTTSTNFGLARQYLQAMSLAFMKTHLARENDYRLFLSSDYANFISQDSLKLNLINSLTETELDSFN